MSLALPQSVDTRERVATEQQRLEKRLRKAHQTIACLREKKERQQQQPPGTVPDAVIAQDEARWSQACAEAKTLEERLATLAAVGTQLEERAR